MSASLYRSVEVSVIDMRTYRIDRLFSQENPQEYPKLFTKMWVCYTVGGKNYAYFQG